MVDLLNLYLPEKFALPILKSIQFCGLPSKLDLKPLGLTINAALKYLYLLLNGLNMVTHYLIFLLTDHLLWILKVYVILVFRLVDD